KFNRQPILGFLGGNDNDAIAKADAPDRCRRGIFQYCNALYVIGIDVVQVTLVREVVDNDEWPRAGKYSAPAPYAQSVRISRIPIDQQAIGDPVQPGEQAHARVAPDGLGVYK